MPDRPLNGLPTFSNPFTAKADRFMLWGFRKMALGVLMVSLEELTWDPAQGRSPQEREEMARVKDEAGPWFDSDAFEAFASMARLPVSNKLLRQRCLSEPLVVMEELHELRQAMDEQRVSEQRRAARAALAPKNLPANNWLFGDVIESLSQGVHSALARARCVGTSSGVQQGFLFDAAATAEERAVWASVARDPVRHRVSA